MKKFFTVLILALLLAAPSFSQHFFIGVGGSVMSTWITNIKSDTMPDPDYKYKFGPSFCFNAGFEFTKSLALLIEPGYGVLGQKLGDKKADTNYSRTITLKYFQVPVLFKYSVGGKLTRFFVALGPQFNMLMSASQVYTKADNPFDDQFTNPRTHKKESFDKSDIKDHFNSLDIMARMDFGVEFRIISKLMIDAGVSLEYGLMDINSSDWKVTKDGKYAASHNIAGGATVGLNYIF
jgi:hypothetical protein